MWALVRLVWGLTRFFDQSYTKTMNYTIDQFKKQFPDEEACLSYIFQNKYGVEFTCPKCSKPGNFSKASNRRCYACAWCGYQLYPTAGTIFHKSRIPLTDWFFLLYLASNSKNALQIEEIQQYVGVTKTTAERILEKLSQI